MYLEKKAETISVEFLLLVSTWENLSILFGRVEGKSQWKMERTDGEFRPQRVLFSNWHRI